MSTVRPSSTSPVFPVFNATLIDKNLFGSYNSYLGRGTGMSSVGIKELKNRLTAYIRLAKQGEEIVVTERGRPVVLMQALRKAKDVKSLEARLARLADRGIVTLPDRRPPAKIKPVRAPGMLASRIIVEERR